MEMCVVVALGRALGNSENVSICWKKEGHLVKLVWRLKRRPKIPKFTIFLVFPLTKRQEVFDHAFGKNTGARICPLGHKKNHRDHRDHRNHRNHRATLLLLFLRGQVGKLAWRLKMLPKPCKLFTFFPKSTNGNVCCCGAWKGAWKLRKCFYLLKKKEGHLGKLVWRLKRRPKVPKFTIFVVFPLTKRQVFDHAYGKNTGARICPLGHKKKPLTPSGPPPKCCLAKFGQTKLAKFGQIRMAKCGQLTLAKCGISVWPNAAK